LKNNISREIDLQNTENHLIKNLLYSKNTLTLIFAKEDIQGDIVVLSDHVSRLIHLYSITDKVEKKLKKTLQCIVDLIKKIDK